MSSFNRVTLVGRLTQDPELRQTSQGKSVAKMRLAVNRRPSRDGTQSADFFNIVAWEKLAETCDRILRKGRLILVDGNLRQRQFTDAQGQKRQTIEIVAQTVRFLDRGPSQEPRSEEDSGVLHLEETDTVDSPMLEELEDDA